MPMKKTEVQDYIATSIAEELNIDFAKAKKAVRLMERDFQDLTRENLKTDGQFNFLGLFTVKGQYKAAQKGGKKMHNHMTGLDYVTKDKPEQVRTTIRPMKKIKDIATEELTSIRKVHKRKEKEKNANSKAKATPRTTAKATVKSTTKKTTATTAKPEAKKRIVRKRRAVK